jgi:hypothetical protein
LTVFVLFLLTPETMMRACILRLGGGEAIFVEDRKLIHGWFPVSSSSCSVPIWR